MQPTLRKNIPNKQPHFNIRELEKEEQTKPKGSTRKEMTKPRAEVNYTETRKTTEKNNKTKAHSACL